VIGFLLCSREEKRRKRNEVLSAHHPLSFLSFFPSSSTFFPRLSQAQSRLRSAALERAEASKLTVIKAAEADAEAKYLAGAGIARQRQAIIAGLRESIKDFSSDVDGVSSRDVITLMITNQYLDAIQNMAQSGSASTIFLPHSPGAVSDLGAQIRDAFVQGSAVASAVSAVPGEQRMGR
jgi:hypothetical protein